MTLDSKYLEGKQDILQRHNPCNCGCGGRDPWHAAHTVRVLHDVVRFDTPTKIKIAEYPYSALNVIAIARYKHPDGPRYAGLRTEVSSAGRRVIIGWARLDDDDARKYDQT